jgi:alcohol dehydrogenase
MLKFNSDPKRSPDCFKDYKILADALCPHMTSQGNGRETLIFVLQNLAKLGNLKIKLSDHGIDEKDIDMLADDAMKQTRLLVNNPKEITREDAYNIYKEVF